MQGVNITITMGNLGRDPEFKVSQNGTAVARFSLACNSKRKQGEQLVDETEWVNIVAFGKTAEIVGKYVLKGDALHVVGRLQTSSWEKEGEKRYKTEVIADRVTLLPNGRGKGEPRPVGAQGEMPPEGFPNDDIPF